MSFEGWFTLAIVVACFVALIRNWAPPDLLFLAGTALLALVGVITPDEITMVGDREVVGRFSPDEAPKMGEQMPLAIDMTRACLFDPETQRLI